MFIRNQYMKTVLRNGLEVGSVVDADGTPSEGGISGSTQNNIASLKQADKNNQAFATAAGEAQANMNMTNTLRGVIASIGR